MIETKIRTKDVRNLARTIIKQFPFATYKALNRLALEAQRFQRFHQNRVFTIRQKTYWKQSVKITQFAKRKGPYRAVMAVDPKGKTPKFDIWRRQEHGGTRTPQQGRKKLAIPPQEKSQYSQVGLEYTSRGLIPKRLRPRNLNRTFTIDFGNGKVGLFRRISSRMKGYTKVAPGQRFGLRDDPNVQLMYILHDRAEVDAVYDFYGNAERTYKSKWRRYFDEELVKAFSTARLRGVKRR